MDKINSQRTLIAQWLIFADVAVWLAVSAWEGSASIFLIHVSFLLLSILIINSIDKGAYFVFSIGLLLRSGFAVLAWYTAYDDTRRFYVGTNSDSSRFWEAAQLSFEQASLSFEDPLFPRLSVLLTKISQNIDNAHYLATMQSVLMAGALMVVFGYIFVKQHYNLRVATITGLLFAFSPIAITFSTGLMRDSLIGAFGFALLWSVSAIKYRGSEKSMFALVIISVLCLVALAYLRSISLAAFVLAGAIVIISSSSGRISKGALVSKLLVIIIMGGLLGFAVFDRFDRFGGALDYARIVRAGEGFTDGMYVNPDGITTRIAEISPLLFAVVSPITLMQPIPFNAWEAPAYVGGPPALMDIVQGFGGLFNQLIFGFYILGTRHWLISRDTLGWRLGVVFIVLFGTMTFIGLGQVRMIMSHVYIFFYAGVAVFIHHALIHRPLAIIRSMVAWLSTLCFLYIAYIAYRNDFGFFVAMLFASMAVVSFIFMWSQYPHQKNSKNT